MTRANRPLVSWCLGIMTLGAAGGCSQSAPVRFEEKAWTSPAGVAGRQILTQHYDLRITSRDTLLIERLPTTVEAAHAGYARALPLPETGDERMTVYLFASRDEWAEFTRLAYPAQARVYMHIQAGGFVDHASGAAVIHDLGRDRTLSLLGHEGFHQYARRLQTPLPPWVNEGMACQWEYVTFDGDRPVFTPEQNLFRRNSLRDAMSDPGGWIPLSRLLAMDAGEAVVATGRTVRSYYAQVWALVLYLRIEAKGPVRKGLEALLRDAATGSLTDAISAHRAAVPEAAGLSNGEIVFRQYISENVDALDREYQAFAARLVYR